MGLPWVRLDAGLARNHKVLGLLDDKDGYRTAFVYVCALGYSGEQGTAGFIPRSALPFIHARILDVNRLVEARLFVTDTGGGGWNVHDWAQFQPTTEEHELRSKRARDAAAVRWGKGGAKK